ncbi:MAG: DUF6600 domain-containing protein [Candidatus Aminicenantaceae bacterium]
MKKFALATVIFLFIFTSVNAQEEKYTNDSVARLSHFTGNIYIQKATDLGYEEGVVNMPISEGDRVGTTDGRAEFFLGRGNYIRLDKNTKIDFERLPKHNDRLFRFQVWSGNIYLIIGTLENEKDIEIHSSDVSVYILDKGLYRIDVRSNVETEIFVFNGLVEAASESGSILIKDEQRLEATEGNFTSRPTSFFAAANDSFDRWSQNRDSLIKRHLAKQYLPDELEDFEYELAEYGEWVHSPPYGWVWVPGGIDPSWLPYNNGRWIWLPISGWTWLPYESWGWVTHHYGRWQRSPLYGWYWIPGSVWGPGWVSWFWGTDYIGWSPMSYWGYPGVFINNRYYGRYSGQPYPYNSGSLTVIRKSQLKARNVSKVSLSQESIQNLGKFKLNNQKPTFTPARSTFDIQKLKAAPRPTAIQSVKLDSTRIKKLKSYPSSGAITAKKYSSSKSVKKPSSAISRIYQRISKRRGTISKGSSRSTSPRSSSTRSKSSKSGSSSSSRVKKIKK